MYKHLLIVGSGGHGQSVADLALSSGQFEKVSFVDDSYPSLSDYLSVCPEGGLLGWETPCCTCDEGRPLEHAG
jgi:hypothetical protein